MGKKILGVILGYIVMVVIVVGGLSIAYTAVGADVAYEEGTYATSMTWNILMIVVGLVAAIVGGFLCWKISFSSGAVQSLAALVFVLGGLSAGVGLLVEKEDAGPRTSDVSNMEAMQRSEQPAWTLVANPIVGVVGVMLGGCMLRKKGGGSGAPDATPSA